MTGNERPPSIEVSFPISFPYIIVPLRERGDSGGLAVNRIPLGLKVGWTLWVGIWIPFYWAYYGPQNFVWFCDIANLVLTVALWRESPLLFSWQAISVFLVQIAMTVDILGRLLLGFHPIGGTEYMWDPNYPLHIRLLSLFHVVMPAVLLWALVKLRYDRRAFLLQVISAWIILPVSYLFGPERDINWSWGPFDHLQEVIPSGAYLAVCMIAYPLLLYLPSHLALSKLFAKGRGSEALRHSEM